MRNNVLFVFLSQLFFVGCNANYSRGPERDAGPLVCNDNAVNCGDVCADLRTDIHNCGGCGHSCDETPLDAASCVDNKANCLPQRCVEGWCTPPR